MDQYTAPPDTSTYLIDFGFSSARVVVFAFSHLMLCDVRFTSANAFAWHLKVQQKNRKTTRTIRKCTRQSSYLLVTISIVWKNEIHGIKL